jgi:hypothetical protein
VQTTSGTTAAFQSTESATDVLLLLVQPTTNLSTNFTHIYYFHWKIRFSEALLSENQEALLVGVERGCLSVCFSGACHLVS